MPIRAFRMRVKQGRVEEYKRRQAQVWPDLALLLRQVGIYDYSIFLDEETLNLFAVLKLWPDHQVEDLPSHPVMKYWWDCMAELMEVDSRNRPREWPLQQAFHFA